jgi:flagellar basal body-associated protein FliL
MARGTASFRDPHTGKPLRVRNAPSKGETLVVHILLVIVIALVLLIAGGTVYALLIRQPSRGEAPVETAALPVASGSERYASIGRLRLQTAGPESATVVFSITFPYDAEDRFFAEEIAAREKDFRDLTASYVSALSAEELHNLDEERLKGELLSRYNGLLRLGRIQTLYLIDFNIIP